jgi:hypothetical protein
VVTDLVEYLIVVVPDVGSLASVATALAGLDGTATIRILDLVAVVKDDDGAVSVLELQTVESMAALDTVDGEVGGLLSEHDIELATTALPNGSAGIVVVTEDRWAEPLSRAARGVGGRIAAGERIPGSRRLGASQSASSDLLPRAPFGTGEVEQPWAVYLVDPAAQVRELADLLHRGLLSVEEFERQKAKVLGH